MKNAVDIHQALRVFTKIKQRGKAIDTGHTHQGITASSDFDGYTVVLADDYVSLTIYFHNKYQLDYSNNQALMNFMDRLSAIDAVK